MCRLLLLLILTGCTLTEEPVGALPYDLEGVPTLLLVGESATLRLTSPELERLEINQQSDDDTVTLDSRRVDDALELTLSIADTTRPGTKEVTLDLSAGLRAAQVSLTFTVASATLELEPDVLILPVGGVAEVQIDAQVEGTDEVGLAVESGELLSTTLVDNILTVRALGACAACSVRIGLLAAGREIVTAELMVSTREPASLGLEVSPRLLNLDVGGAATATLTISKEGLTDAVALSVDAPSGIDVTLPDATLDAQALVFIVAAGASPSTYALVFTAQSGEVQAQTELLVVVNQGSAEGGSWSHAAEN